MGSIIIGIFATATALNAQVFSYGADPVSIRWKSLESEHFRIVYQPPNFEAILHGGATIGAYEELLRVNKDSYLEPYAGATLRVHLGNFLWAPYDTYFGVRYLYNFADPAKSGLEVVYSLDI